MTEERNVVYTLNEENDADLIEKHRTMMALGKKLANLQREGHVLMSEALAIKDRFWYDLQERYDLSVKTNLSIDDETLEIYVRKIDSRLTDIDKMFRSGRRIDIE